MLIDKGDKFIENIEQLLFLVISLSSLGFNLRKMHPIFLELGGHLMIIHLSLAIHLRCFLVDYSILIIFFLQHLIINHYYNVPIIL